MEEKLLRGIIPSDINNRELVLEAKDNYFKLLEKGLQFKDEINNIIFKTVFFYFKATQNFLDVDQFKDVLVDNKVDPEKVAKAVIAYELYAREYLPKEKFEFYLGRATENRDKISFENTLLEALNILKGPDDIKNNTTALQLAKDRIIPSLFDSAMVAQDTPHGDITKEGAELLVEYEKAEEKGVSVGGMTTGIKKIDEAIETILPGQLVTVAAASGEGKSFFATNLAWHIAVEEGKNVVVITAETLRDQYRRRVIARHSNKVEFGCPLELTKIKNGTLSEEEKEVYKMVVDDFTSGQYGSLDISQVTNGTTLEDIRIYLEKLRLTKRIDMVIIDYLSLLSPVKRTGNAREDISALFKAAKNLAVSFNKGEGIPVVTLHQIAFQARDKVKFQPGKFYSLSSLADTSEAAKSSDTIIAFYRDEDMIEEHELGCGVLKTRDSYSPDRLFKLYEAYTYAYIGDLTE